MSHLLLYLTATLIWGSTWLAITFQYGTVPASASVAYRFLLAGLLLLAWCRLRGISLHLPRARIGGVALQGALMFGVSYMLVYEAEKHIASGLMAVLNSSMVVFNLIGMRLCFGKQIDAKSAGGASLGVLGIGLIFWPELRDIGSHDALLGIACGLAAAILASMGNIVAQYNGQKQVVLLPGIAYGMLTGGSLALAYTVLSGQGLSLDLRPAYLGSLLYLAVFGSVLAFAAYLTLLRRIGPAKAGYIAVVIPVVALLLSGCFEGLVWQSYTVAGIACALLGNFIMLGGPTSGAWRKRLSPESPTGVPAHTGKSP